MLNTPPPLRTQVETAVVQTYDSEGVVDTKVVYGLCAGLVYRRARRSFFAEVKRIIESELGQRPPHAEYIEPDCVEDAHGMSWGGEGTRGWQVKLLIASESIPAY